VHLCDAMPEDDQLAWADATGGINAELGEPMLWVGREPSAATAPTWPSSSVRDGVDTLTGECVDRVAVCAGERERWLRVSSARYRASEERGLSYFQNETMRAKWALRSHAS
jgi:hypothetical protein